MTLQINLISKYSISLLLLIGAFAFNGRAQTGATVKADNQDLKGCQNLLRNGDFEKGLASWKVVNFTDGSSTELRKQGKNSYVELSHIGKRDWTAIGQEIKSRLELGETYVVSVRYKVETNLSFGVLFGNSSLVMHSSAINQRYGWDRLIIGDESWRTDTFEFTASENFPKANEPMFGIYFNYNNTGNILIDDVILAPRTTTCRPK